MHIWRTLRNLITYRSLFAASVDREMRRRLGHDDVPPGVVHISIEERRRVLADAAERERALVQITAGQAAAIRRITQE